MFEKVTKIALAGVIGVGTLFGSSAFVSAEVVNNYDTKANVEFEENKDITPPVDPEDPDPTNPVDPEVDPEVPGQEIEPGTQGPLSIDYASHFNFGKIKKSGNAATYKASPISIILPDTTKKDVAPYVQITDNRGSHAGWTLNVKQAEQLANVDTDSELDGAQITLTEGVVTGTAATDGIEGVAVTLNPTGEATPVFGAAEGSKGGTFTNSFGTAEEVGVELAIEAGTKIDDGLYQANIEWTLEDTPQ